MKTNRKGFTLIELMVVIAIIIILAAIAIPNYINMTKRANVSRATSDLTVIATALECYKTDIGTYPPALLLDTTALPTQDTLLVPNYLTAAAEIQITGSETSVTYSGDGAAVWKIIAVTKDGKGTVTDTNGIIVTS